MRTARQRISGCGGTPQSMFRQSIAAKAATIAIVTDRTLCDADVMSPGDETGHIRDAHHGSASPDMHPWPGAHLAIDARVSDGNDRRET